MGRRHVRHASATGLQPFPYPAHDPQALSRQPYRPSPSALRCCCRRDLVDLVGVLPPAPPSDRSRCPRATIYAPAHRAVCCAFWQQGGDLDAFRRRPTRRDLIRLWLMLMIVLVLMLVPVMMLMLKPMLSLR